MNSRMLPPGVLFFISSLILMGVKEKELVLYGHKIVSFPSWLYTALGIIAIIIAIWFVIAVFWTWLAGRLETALEGGGRFGGISVLYWVIFWSVYFVSWLRWLSNIPANSSIFHVAFWMGVSLFFVIPVVWFWTIFQLRRQ